MFTLRNAQVALGGAIVAVVGVLSACSGSGSGAAGGSAPVAADTGKAQKVLAQSSSDLHGLVNRLAASTANGVAGAAPLPECSGVKGLATQASACTSFDNAEPCDAGSTQPWPQRWGYAVNTSVAGGRTDATTAVRAVVTTLQRDRWKVVNSPSSHTSDVKMFTATKPGLAVQVAADVIPGVVNIDAYGTCIAADGSIRS